MTMSSPLTENLPTPPEELAPQTEASPQTARPLPVDLPARPRPAPQPVARQPFPAPPAPPAAAPPRPLPPSPEPMPGPVATGSLPAAPSKAALDLPPAPPEPAEPRPVAEPEPFDLPPLETEDDLPPQGTDADLTEALFPLVESAMGHALYAPETGVHSFLEPLLRTTMRRTLAELEGPDNPFAAAGVLDRMLWRFEALCTSRTYDEILFSKTARHRIEAALLLGHDALDLISYASTDPGCHASPRRVQPLLREILPRMHDGDGALNLTFPLAEDRTGVVREGRFTYLVAVVHGTMDEFTSADLDFIHRRIEERHGKLLQDPSAPLLRRIQPMLEDCLLIRSPAAALSS